MKSLRSDELSVGHGNVRAAFVYLTLALGFVACNDANGDTLGFAAAYAIAVVAAFAILRRIPSFKLPGYVRTGAMFLLPVAALLYGEYKGWSGVDICALVSRAALVSGLLHIVVNRSNRPNSAAVHILNLALFVAAAAWVHHALFFVLLILFAAAYIGAALASVYPPARSTAASYAGIFAIYFAASSPLAAMLFVALPRNELRRPDKHQTKPDDLGKGTTGIDGATGVEKDHGAAFIGAPSRIDHASVKNLEKLLSDNRTVMKMKISTVDGNARPPEEPIYIRTMVYDRYERGVWSSTRGTQRLNDGDDGIEDGWIVLRPLPEATGEVVRQEVTASAILGKALGAIPDALRVRTASLQRIGNDAFSFVEDSDPLRRYVVESARGVSNLNDLDNIVEAGGDNRDLQFPPELKRLTVIAQTATKGDKTIKSKANAIKRLLKHNYGYEAEAVDSNSLDPVEEFLFERRNGVCVHFATAMALMARSIGVHARVGVGFLCSEFSKEEAAFIIRNADAHMWVEIFFGVKGWVIFDPTPDGRWRDREGGDTTIAFPPPRERKGSGKGLGATIFEFSGKDRDRFFASISKFFTASLAFVGGLFSSLIFYATCLAAAGAVFLWYRLTPEKRRDLMMRRLKGFRRRSSVSFYNDFLWELSRLGIKKEPCSTIRDFARRIPSSIPRECVEEIVAGYERIKFGSQTPSPDEEAAVEKAVETIRERGRILRETM